MPGATEARRAMMVLARHEKPLDDEFLVPALGELQSPLWTSEFTRAELQKARQMRKLRGGLDFVYPHPAPSDGEAILVLVLRQTGSFQVSNGRTVSLSSLEKEPEHWLSLQSSYKRLNHTNQLEADWFIEKVQHFLPAFEPEFACGDTDVLLANRFGDKPAEVVWPFVYYGPTHVQRFGRERLLEAPAWEVKEDERGGIWLQAVENPFVTKPADLNALAAHLGLPKRK